MAGAADVDAVMIAREEAGVVGGTTTDPSGTSITVVTDLMAMEKAEMMTTVTALVVGGRSVVLEMKRQGVCGKGASNVAVTA